MGDFDPVWHDQPRSEHRPLLGKTVLITRARAPALALRAEIALGRGDTLGASRHVEDGLALPGLPERLRMELLELAFRVAYAEGRMDEAMQCSQKLLAEAAAAEQQQRPERWRSRCSRCCRSSSG